MKYQLTYFLLTFIFCYACGPEKTIDNREQSAASSRKQEKDEGIDYGDFSDALSEEIFAKKFQVQLDWVREPKVGSKQKNQFKFAVNDLNGNPVKLEFFDFRLYMKIHGHGGLDKNRNVEMEEDEQFICSNFFFTMPGPWELKLRIVIAGEKYAFDFPIEVVGD